MAIANYNTYRSKLAVPTQVLHSTKVSVSLSPGKMHSLWPVTPDAGVVPSVATAPTNTTAGSLGQRNATGIQRIAHVTGSLGSSGYMMLCDRLSHQGGLSGIVTTEQTTNLPTAPLTRYTSGNGVMMALEMYVAVGTTATTVTVSYTNSNGVAGRISEPMVFGGTGFREINRLLIVPLQEGDTGVRSVESVTVPATTGTAGNFGVTLFKPLMAMPTLNVGSQPMFFDSILTLCGNMPAIENGACLQWMVAPNASGIGVLLSSVQIIGE